MYACQEFADFGAVQGSRMFLRFSAQAGDDARRFTVELAKKFIVEISNWAGARNALPSQVGHQVQVIGQIGKAQLFKQGENVLAVIGRDEIIGVFDTRGDALQIDQ